MTARRIVRITCSNPATGTLGLLSRSVHHTPVLNPDFDNQKFDMLSVNARPSPCVPHPSSLLLQWPKA
jgi:hypothetical protein